MSDVAVQAEALGKRYRIGVQEEGYRTIREAITSAATLPVRAAGRLASRASAGDRSSPTQIWALRDVSFEVEHGEALGIIGKNGAGKSTLLKILSRITRPTRGRATVEGRIGALLEVGTGFHPELTGRENIYLNGAVLGMTRRDIAGRFDEIVEFAGIGRYLDTAVKYYSSGMYMRLAFAVAAHLEPDILVIDEVLAVGDAEFQKKCLGRMGDARREGRTILFVSHNMTAVQNLCQRALWLQNGTPVGYGPASSIISKYLQTSSSTLLERVWEDPQTAPGGDVARIHSVRLEPVQTDSPVEMTVRTPLTVEVRYWNLKEGANLNVSLLVSNREGTVIFNSISTLDPEWRDRTFPVGLYSSVCHIPGDLLNDDTYVIGAYVVENRATFAAKVEEAVVFDLQDDSRDYRSGWHGKFAGLVRPRLRWSTSRVAPDLPAGEAPA